MRPWLEHVALRVTDLERSVVFYREVMGFPPVGRRRIMGGEVAQAIFRVGDGVLVLFHADEFVPAEPAYRGGVDHIAFCLDGEDYRAVIRRLRERGHLIHREEEKNLGALGVGYATYFHDPDGIEVEIKRYDDPPEQPGPEWYDPTQGGESSASSERRGRSPRSA